MKKHLAIFASLLAVFILAACNSEGSDKEVESEDTLVEEQGSEKTETDGEEPEDSESTSEEYLSLGETGEVTSVMGDYEVTVQSFEILDELEGREPYLDEFVLVKFEVGNIGDTVIVGEDLLSVKLFDDNELGEDIIYDLDTVNMLDEEEIHPGESKETEMVFEQDQSESYELVFNFGALESNATNVSWKFNADEAENQ
ncbi:protein of unknown function [Gracilibacillus orientalis]|uniref:DUF4352 domain-containing protein n=1 Tax=Gracilibacillus orientalis TaxID=334253 RepID=A0A1I4P573_9BACI|nr:DUF4352 domain-containing protein [Gracilibacillus orientalis]SFM22766.1 protein of unknown function [Gracilibacillus orientalis]